MKASFWSPEDDEEDAAGGQGGPRAAYTSEVARRATPSDPSPTPSEVINAREMLTHVRALREKAELSKSKLARSRELNETLATENERLEAEIEELITQRARLERRPKRGERPPGLGGAGAGAGIVGALDDNVELVELDEDLDVVAEGESPLRSKSLFAALAHLGKRFRQRARKAEAGFLRQLPIVRAVLRLTTRYGASMAVYFSFCAWLQLTSLLQLAILAPLLAKHAIEVASGAVRQTAFESRLVGNTGTWWVWYSSFPESDGALYAVSLGVSLLATIVTSARKFIAERRAAQYAEVYGLGSNRLRFARAVLNGWDCAVASQTGLSDAHSAMADRLRLLVDERQRAARIATRTLSERNGLYARRLLGIGVSMAYTVAAWAGISALSLNALPLSTWLDAQLPGLSILAVVGVPVVVSLVNTLLPLLAYAVTDFERWDFPSTTLRVQVFRLYLGKILNLLINVAGYGVLLATQRSAAPLEGLAVELGGRSFRVLLVLPNNARFGCAENQIGTMLLLFVSVEFVSSKAAELGLCALWRWGLPLLSGRPWAREPFPTAQKVIDLIYFQALLWLCTPFFPYVSALGPLLLRLTFSFDHWLLRAHYAKPVDPWSADEVGAFFFRLFFTTFGVALAWYYLFLRGVGVHACGAHASRPMAWSAIEDWLASSNGVAVVYALLVNSLILWVVIAFAWVRSLTSDSHKELLQDYAEVRIAQLGQQAQLLDARVRLHERQIAAFKRQRASRRER